MKKRGRFEAVPQTPEVKIRGQKPLLQMFVSSMLSLLLCCTMLFSTTMAWFTDTVISSGSQITIGELDVSMNFGGSKQRSADAPLFGGGIAWSPDDFEVRTVTIENNGNLDIQYVLNLVLQTDEDSTAEIAEYLKLYVKQVDQNENIDQLTLKDIQEWECVGGGTLADVFNKGISTAKGSLEAKSGETTPSVTYAIALYLVDNVDGNLMGKSMKLDVKLNAYQSNIDEEDMTEPPDMPAEPAVEPISEEPTITPESTQTTTVTESVTADEETEAPVTTETTDNE